MRRYVPQKGFLTALSPRSERERGWGWVAGGRWPKWAPGERGTEVAERCQQDGTEPQQLNRYRFVTSSLLRLKRLSA